ncbi:MAG: ADP-glyceromanno-heptose 6-epimerase [Pseudomonadota bacterium]
MIVVTGAAGFIGSNLVKLLNDSGRVDIVAIDDLGDGSKAKNLADCVIADYYDKREFLQQLSAGGFNLDVIETVFHMGACSDTTEQDGRYMMENNFTYSKMLLEQCVSAKVPLIYASSGAVYGQSEDFAELPANERPLNVYGYSKLAFDQFVRQRLPKPVSLVAGLRFFNVYGPREQHKGRMASVIWHFWHQARAANKIKLFAGSHGYADGEQRRDFVHVEDVAAATLWFASRPASASGIYNLGTGVSASFNDVARLVAEHCGNTSLEYIPFPGDLHPAYQPHTRAEISKLRGVGYHGPFRDIEHGVSNYLDKLDH